MNKKLIFSFLTIILLACNAVTAPFASRRVSPECAQLDLTPEECANRGVHTYALTGTIHTALSQCSWSENEKSVLTRDMELNLDFTKEDVTICYTYEGKEYCQGYNKMSDNSYVGQYADENTSYPLALTFNSRGMSEEQQNPNCPTTMEYVRSK